MDSGSKRRKSTLGLEQMERLLVFMEAHPELAKGQPRSSEYRRSVPSLWKKCARTMSSHRDGVVRAPREWAKYWSEWKYRVRRRALELKAARDNNKPTNKTLLPLSAIDEKLLALIGEQALEGIKIKADPFDAVSDDEPVANDESVANDVFEDSAPVNPDYDKEVGKHTRACRTGRKRRYSSSDSESSCQSSRKKGGNSRQSSQGSFSSTRSRKGIKRRRSSHISKMPSRERSHTSRRRYAGDGDSEPEDDAAVFLGLERQKLETTKELIEAVQSVAFEARQMVSVLIQIKDVLTNSIESIR